jgi:hypothetical protein
MHALVHLLRDGRVGTCVQYRLRTTPAHAARVWGSQSESWSPTDAAGVVLVTERKLCFWIGVSPGCLFRRIAAVLSSGCLLFGRRWSV